MTAAVPFIAILLSAALLLAGNGLAFVLVPIYGDAQGFGDTAIGLVGAGYFTGFVVGCMAVPHLIGRAGHIRTYAALTSTAAVAILLLPQLVSPEFWILLRLFSGFCLAGLYTTIESWLNECSESHQRGRVLSIYTVISLTVVSIGILLINTGDATQGLYLFTLAAIFYCLSVIPISMTAAPAPSVSVINRVPVRRLYRDSAVGVIGCLVTGLANGAFWALGPLFVKEIGFTVGNATIFMAATVIGGALFQWPLGSMSDRLDRRVIIGLGSFGAGLAGIALAVLPDNAGIFGAISAGIIYGCLAFPLYAISVAHVNDTLEPGEFVSAGGTLVLLFGFGAAIGPLIASALISLTSVHWLFAYTATIHLVFAGFVANRLRLRVAISGEEKSEFVAFSAATPTALDLDPRSENESAIVGPAVN